MKYAIEKYYHYKKNTEIAGNEIMKSYGSGIVYKDPEYFNSQVMTSVLFEYIIDGEGFVKYADKTYHVKAGDCVIIRPDSDDNSITYGADKYNPYTKYWFTCMGTFTDNIFKAYDVEDLVIIKKADVSDYFEALLSTIADKEPSLSDFSVTIVKILNELYMTKSESLSDITLKDKIETFVSKRLTTPATIAEISNHFGINDKTFSLFFKSKFGVTYHKYVMKKRLELAKTLILKTNRRVSDIASELNFCDQSYFSHSFKKEFGVYPSQIRRK